MFGLFILYINSQRYFPNKLGDGAMTEMACDNMHTEDALRRILPDIATIDAENDSIVRLNCKNHSSYLILKKNSAYEVK